VWKSGVLSFQVSSGRVQACIGAAISLQFTNLIAGWVDARAGFDVSEKRREEKRREEKRREEKRKEKRKEKRRKEKRKEKRREEKRREEKRRCLACVIPQSLYRVRFSDLSNTRQPQSR
jgi:sRNA-binding protein